MSDQIIPALTLGAMLGFIIGAGIAAAYFGYKMKRLIGTLRREGWRL